MTNEQKRLLLKDICARIPYGIFVKECDVNDRVIYTYDYHPHIETCKPYLRPMSSMTEEEIEFMDDNGFRFYKKANDFDNVGDVSDDGWDKNYVDKESFENVIDFFYSHHLDYRGLIEKGLALEAPEGMYES